MLGAVSSSDLPHQGPPQCPHWVQLQKTGSIWKEGARSKRVSGQLRGACGSPSELMGSFASAESAASTASAASFLWESPWLKVLALSQVSPHPLPHLSTTL